MHANDIVEDDILYFSSFFECKHIFVLHPQQRRSGHKTMRYKTRTIDAITPCNFDSEFATIKSERSTRTIDFE